MTLLPGAGSAPSPGPAAGLSARPRGARAAAALAWKSFPARAPQGKRRGRGARGAGAGPRGTAGLGPLRKERAPRPRRPAGEGQRRLRGGPRARLSELTPGLAARVEPRGTGWVPAAHLSARPPGPRPCPRRYFSAGAGASPLTSGSAAGPLRGRDGDRIPEPPGAPASPPSSGGRRRLAPSAPGEGGAAVRRAGGLFPAEASPPPAHLGGQRLRYATRGAGRPAQVGYRAAFHGGLAEAPTAPVGWLD